MEKLYYTAPSDEIFNEVKEKCIEIWRGCDNTYDYVMKKICDIENLENIQDNVMSIIAMFDHFNMMKLAEKLSPEARRAIRERMISGGNSEEYTPF